jgi:hypothetical protein
VVASLIPTNEVDFHPLSFADPSGRLFRWRGGLYRGISEENKRFYRQLLGPGIVRDLIAKGMLVETELSDFSLNSHPLVLKHQSLPFVSYVYEWPFMMLKDAALAVIDIMIELAPHKLTLKDGHPWNILFKGCRPTYVDFGSIVPLEWDNEWPGADEFYGYFLYPLSLMTCGHGRIARLLLHDHEQGILKSEFQALSGIPSFVRPTELKRRLFSFASSCVPEALVPGLKKVLTSLSINKAIPSFQSSFRRLDYLKQIRKDVESLTLPLQRSEWSHYYDDDEFPSFSPSNKWTPKHLNVFEILTDLKPTSLLDIGSNRGWYAQLAASIGINTVAFDTDETAINRFYCDVKQQNAPILPLVMDFRNPSPGYGVRNEMVAPAVARLNCDMVLALALVHHLVFKQYARFDQIVSGLDSFAKRWVVVEFIPKEDQFVSKWWSPQYTWYTLENFMNALTRCFRKLTILPSDPQPRVLVLCEK